MMMAFLPSRPLAAPRRHHAMAASLGRSMGCQSASASCGPKAISFSDLLLSYHRDIVLTRGPTIFIHERDITVLLLRVRNVRATPAIAPAS